MTKLKVSDLEGAYLDYAVAKCEGRSYTFSISTGGDYNGNTTHGHIRNYSSNWSLAGPIIEKERIDIQAMINSGSDYDEWSAIMGIGNRQCRRYGPTPMVAAMRCYVASKHGREIEIPEILT